MRFNFEGSADELAALVVALRAGGLGFATAGLSLPAVTESERLPPVSETTTAEPTPLRPVQINATCEADDDDYDDDTPQPPVATKSAAEQQRDAEAQAQAILSEEIVRAANHGDALLAVLKRYPGRQMSAAVLFERVRMARSATIGSLDHALKMLTHGDQVRRHGKGVVVYVGHLVQK